MPNIIVDDKVIVLATTNKKSEEQLIDELYHKVDLIHERIKRAAIDYTRIELERAVQLCNEIMSERQNKKSLLKE